MRGGKTKLPVRALTPNAAEGQAFTGTRIAPAKGSRTANRDLCKICKQARVGATPSCKDADACHLNPGKNDLDLGTKNTDN